MSLPEYIKKKLKSLNSSGVIHLIPLFLILLGITFGVYLVQKEGFQIFQPKATAQNVEWILSNGDANNCVTSSPDGTGKIVTTCPNVKFKLTSPSVRIVQSPSTPTLADEIQNMSLVKTVYAAGSGEGYFCKEDRSKIYHKECTNYQSISPVPWLPLYVPICIGDWGKSEREENCDEGNVCTADGAGASCKEPPKPSDEGQDEQIIMGSPKNGSGIYESELDGKAIVFDFAALSTRIKKFRFMITSDDGTINSNSDCPSFAEKYFFCSEYTANKKGDKVVAGINLPVNILKDGVTYTWWVDGLDGENPEALITSDGSKFTVHRSTNIPTSQPVVTPAPQSPRGSAVLPPGTIAPPGTSPAGGGGGSGPGSGGASVPSDCRDNPVSPPSADTKWFAECTKACSQNSPDCTPNDKEPNFIVPETSNWCYGFEGGKIGSSRCMQLRYIGGSNGKSSCQRGDVGSITPLQANCVLRLRGDVLTNFQKDGWCADESNKQAIVNNWYNKLASSKDKQDVTSCFTTPTIRTGSEGGPLTTLQGSVRLFTKYRVSEDPSSINSASWQNYTQEGVIVSYQFRNGSFGAKFIYAQFSDESGNVVSANPYPASIELIDESSICPSNNLLSFDISTLMKRCKNNLKILATIPTEKLAELDNSILIEIGNATNDLGGFLSRFSVERLRNFDTDILKELPSAKLNEFPKELRDRINGISSALSGKCSSITASFSSGRISASPRFEGNPKSARVWISSNPEIGKPVQDVLSWSPLNMTSQSQGVISGPVSSNLYNFDVNGVEAGQHVLLLALYDEIDSMLDGNPGGVVNTSCTTTINID